MASKRNLRRHACTGKQRFPTMDLALQFRRDTELKAYPCSFCCHWHLGHPPAEHKDRSGGLLK